MTGIVPHRAIERCEALAKLGWPPSWWRMIARRRWLRAYRAIMALDISEGAEMLREVYTDEQLRELATAPNPFIRIDRIDKATPTARAPIGRWVEPFFPVDQRPRCFGSYGSNHGVPLHCSPAAGCGLRDCPAEGRPGSIDPDHDLAPSRSWGGGSTKNWGGKP